MGFEQTHSVVWGLAALFETLFALGLFNDVEVGLDALELDVLVFE